MPSSILCVLIAASQFDMFLFTFSMRRPLLENGRVFSIFRSTIDKVESFHRHQNKATKLWPYSVNSRPASLSREWHAGCVLVIIDQWTKCMCFAWMCFLYVQTENAWPILSDLNQDYAFRSLLFVRWPSIAWFKFNKIISFRLFGLAAHNHLPLFLLFHSLVRITPGFFFQTKQLDYATLQNNPTPVWTDIVPRSDWLLSISSNRPA